MISIKIIKKPKKGTASSGGGSSAHFGKSTTDRVAYADNAGNADYAAKAGSADYAENAARANYANMAGFAQDLAEGAEAYNKFLRKDISDTAQGKITFNSGILAKIHADFGTFLSDWLLGTGARIDEDGNAEVKSLKVRESLDVAQLVFNKITARDAEEIISPGRGTIESVTKTGTLTGTITLKLQENEWATIAAGDICRGIYNNLAAETPSNWDADDWDTNGFRRKKGFFTAYFRVMSVTTNSAGHCAFTYQLQTGTTEHPCENMNFAVYGNRSNTSRQSSIYITAMGMAPRIVFLAGVNNYKIEPKNFKIAIGNIQDIVVIEELADASEYNDSTDPDKWTETVDGVVHYYAHKTLEGDAGFYCEDNIYLGGVINQFKAAALDIIDSHASNLGQSWVLVNRDILVVDCNSDGTVKTTTQFTLDSWLHFGSETCTLNTGINNGPICYYSLNGTKAQPSFSENNTKASKTYTFAAGSSLSSGYITVYLKGTHNGTTYSASKTVAIIANREGAQGDPGAAIRFLGNWVDTMRPVWNSTFRDCVKHNGVYWLVAVPSDGSTSLGEPATNNSNWQNNGAMRFIATELLLAENGTIDLLSSNVINLYNGDNRTASINADGNGSYCIYYLGSGNKRMEFSSDGFIYYYNDDEDNTLAWKLGHGGDITKSSSDDWQLYPLHLLTAAEKQNLSENSVFDLTNYWMFKSGSGGQFSAYDGRIYRAIPLNRNPANGITIANGEYTRQYRPYQVMGATDAVAAIEVLTITNGEIVSTTEITES